MGVGWGLDFQTRSLWPWGLGNQPSSWTHGRGSTACQREKCQVFKFEDQGSHQDAGKHHIRIGNRSCPSLHQQDLVHLAARKEGAVAATDDVFCSGRMVSRLGGREGGGGGVPSPGGKWLRGDSMRGRDGNDRVGGRGSVWGKLSACFQTTLDLCVCRFVPLPPHTHTHFCLPSHWETGAFTFIPSHDPS